MTEAFDPARHAVESLGLPPIDPPADKEAESLDLIYRNLCRQRLIHFIKYVAPWFNVEEIHIAIAHFLEALANGHIDRGMVFMPPRTGKSQMASVFLPAWEAGRNPDGKIMQISYKSQLAEGFSRDVRDFIRYEDYNIIFPGVGLKADKSAVGRWGIDSFNMEDGMPGRPGEYVASGTTGGIAGTGFNLGVIDDPMSEQDKDSDVALQRVRDWFGPGFYTRRQPEYNRIVIMMTRWRANDLAGYLLDQGQTNEDADLYHVLSIPAILDDEAAARINKMVKQAVAADPLLAQYVEGGIREMKAGDSFSPRRWPVKELMRSKNQMSRRDWEALYMQRPTEEEGEILKRKHWRKWPDKKVPPNCEYILQCYDTAFEDTETADYSARTTWGVFWRSDENLYDGGQYSIILLERWKGQVTFPELRDIALEGYNQYRPDKILIEKRASGASLVQELFNAHLPVHAWLPPGVRGQKGKIPRAHGIQVVFEQGAVWYMDRNWAKEVIDQCAVFPRGDFDDLVDTVTMALSYLRKQYWVTLKTDQYDEDDDDALKFAPERKNVSYG